MLMQSRRLGWRSYVLGFQAGLRWISRFCVVGSGPAGFYTTDKILKRFGEDTKVDILERLPTPFGLVRTGVAPDHQDTKNVTNKFSSIMKDPRVRWLGNVKVGRDIQVDELLSKYNGVVLCYGAESDRKLGIPGEDLGGVVSAREFVWWYNGHPDYQHLKFNLNQIEEVAIIGLGNVAIDCARILLKDPQEMAKTDITLEAQQQLKNSSVKKVTLIGRRGPIQASFSPRELKEILNLQNIKVCINSQDLELSVKDEGEIRSLRKKWRIYDLLTASQKHARESMKELHIKFFSAPQKFTSEDQKTVSNLHIQRTKLDQDTGKIVVTDDFENLPTQLVLKSIGYKGLAVSGVPFNEEKGIVPNYLGRVLSDEKGEPVRGLYVCGWVKRGPSGIIGTNLVDAEQTVDIMYQDLKDALRPEISIRDPLEKLIASGMCLFDEKQWDMIDKHEIEEGQRMGKTRAKIVSWKELFKYKM